ncbi:MAG: ABC transporter permease [Myxococcaceae bacterium]
MNTVAVVVPPRTFRNDLRAVKIVWQREMIRFFSDKPRLLVTLVQPVLYLFVLGAGLGTIATPSPGLSLQVFMFPGVMSMSVLFTCFFTAGSLVWDREFGFMREMLVAPVRRSAILLGKCLGGAAAGGFQGVLVMALGWFVGVPFSLSLVVTLSLVLLLLSFAITALGVLVAVRIRQMQSFMALVQMLVLPMSFLSGALYPLDNLPPWLALVTRLDPLTYAVDPMRRMVLGEVTHGAFSRGITWSGQLVPIGVELLVVFGFGLAAFLISVVQFNRHDA